MEWIKMRGLVTVVAFAAYLGVVWWAYRGQSRIRFEQDAWLPFDDGDRPDAAVAATREQQEAGR